MSTKATFQIQIEPLTFESLSNAPESFDEETRTVKFMASDETPFMRFDWESWQPYVLILDHSSSAVDLSRVKAESCMFLEDHRSSADYELGKVLEGKVKDKQLHLSVKLHPDEKGDRFFKRVQNKTQSPTSVGALPLELKLVSKPEFEIEEATGHRKLIKPSVVRATKWTVMEFSAVSIPAIPNSGILSMDGDRTKLNSEQLITCSVDGDMSSIFDETQPPVQIKPKGSNMNLTDLTNEELIEKLQASEKVIAQLQADQDKNAVTTATMSDQLALLHQQVSTLTSQHHESSIDSQYQALNFQALRLMNDEGKLSAPEYEKYFGTEQLATYKDKHGDLRLEAVTHYLSEVEKREPLLTLRSPVDNKLSGGNPEPTEADKVVEQVKLQMSEAWKL